MKCPKCGAEINNTKFCEYCGSQITTEMQKEQEIINKSGCPKCGSSNVQFKRENQGEIRGKNSKQVVHRTVGLCKDCGETWYVDEVPKKRKTWLWVLGWIFVFPLPLTILLLNKKDMNKYLKYGIIAVAWIVYLIIGFTANSDNKSTTANSVQTTITTTESTSQTTTDQTTTKEVTTQTTTVNSASIGERNALNSALSYLDYSGFSEKSLKDQLEYEGYSSEEIKYAIENCNADWNEECVESAEQYLDYSSFSRQELIEQLKYEGFSTDQINYALDSIGY